ncbi:MAG: hypothetical protein LBO09_03670 [Candidatus Peribacteria bacterium]|jgi:hypothetical protein|nr:hypothetical protein [Candidatus Peribacteria bacterium]
MKKTLLTTLAVATLVLTACGTEPTTPTDIDEDTGTIENLEAEAVVEAVSPAIIGVADNADAEVSVQDGAYYYDFGTVNAEDTNYPLAFAIDFPASDISELTATVVANDGFIVDTTSTYTQGELFTITTDPTAETGARSAIIQILGTTINGDPIEALFVAVANLE